jgi:hypothetical protein
MASCSFVMRPSDQSVSRAQPAASTRRTPSQSARPPRRRTSTDRAGLISNTSAPRDRANKSAIHAPAIAPTATGSIPRLGLPVAPNLERDVDLVARRDLPQMDEPVHVPKREVAPKCGVGGREHQRRPADADGQGQRRGNRESRGAQAPKMVGLELQDREVTIRRCRNRLQRRLPDDCRHRRRGQRLWSPAKPEDATAGLE